MTFCTVTFLNKCHICEFLSAQLNVAATCDSDGLSSLFQHALRLLAFGQLYKVLNMDPLPACKPSPRLLEGV